MASLVAGLLAPVLGRSAPVIWGKPSEILVVSICAPRLYGGQPASWSFRGFLMARIIVTSVL